MVEILLRRGRGRRCGRRSDRRARGLSDTDEGEHAQDSLRQTTASWGSVRCRSALNHSSGKSPRTRVVSGNSSGAVYQATRSALVQMSMSVNADTRTNDERGVTMRHGLF